MTIVKAAASKVVGGVRSWWGDLNGHDRVVAILVALVVGVLGYQHIALSHARQDVVNMQLQIANMATKQQFEALDKSIKDVDQKAGEAKAVTEIARIETQASLQKLSRPYKSMGMKSNEIVNGFQNLSSGSSH